MAEHIAGSARPVGGVPRAWRPIGSDAVPSRIRSEILRYITDQGIDLGSRLPSERELAALLSVSRPSVREAVRTLQAQGVLEVRHGSGVFVRSRSPMTQARTGFSLPEDLSDLYDMREVLEVPAARWAATRQLPQLTAVAGAFDDLEAALDESSTDYDELQRLDTSFHTRIVQACGNPLLEQTQAVIAGLILEGMQTTLSRPGRIERSRQEHRMILGALLEGDADLAEAAVRAHIAGARSAMRAGLAESVRDAHLASTAANE